MAQRFYLPREQVFTDLGAIGAGWKLYSYETTLETPLATYSDTALSVANANPTIADSAGRLGDIFVGDLKLYKFVLKDDSDNTIWTADPADPKIFSLNDFSPRPTSFWGTTAGTADAFTLVSDPVITAYSSTQTFFAACHLDNNASSTLAIDSLVALNEKKYDGAGSKVALEAGDKQAGQVYEYYNDGTDLVVLNPEKPHHSSINLSAASTSAKGVNELLTNAELLAGTDTERAATAASILSLFAASTQSETGEIKLPINISGSFSESVLKFGKYTYAGTHGSSYSPTFAAAFDNACHVVLYITSLDSVSTASGHAVARLTAKSASGFTFQHGNDPGGGTSAATMYYIAIGN